MSRIVLTICARHPKINARELSDRLGIVPDVVNSVGQQRLAPDNTPLPGQYEETYIAQKLAMDENKLPEVIKQGIARVEPSMVNRLREEGGGVELFIGWFIDRNEDVLLSQELLTSVAETGVSIRFDIYPPDSEGSAA